MIGNIIKKHRKLKMLSMKELGEKLGITKQAIFHIEKKDRPVKKKQFETLCKTLGDHFRLEYIEKVKKSLDFL